MPVAKVSSLEGIDCKFLCASRKPNVIVFILKVNVGCYIYTIVYWIVVRLKTEHHAICVTQENLPTTNIHTHIDLTIQISNQPLINKKWSKHVKYIKRNQNNYVQKQTQWNLLFVLFVRFLCSSLWKLKRKKAFVSVQTKF